MKTLLLATLATLALGVAPGVASAQAQTSAPATPRTGVSAGTLRAPVGVSPAALIAWLTTQGTTASAVQQDGDRRFIRVDVDGLAWLLFLQSCEGDRCSDLQFSAGVSNAAITPDMINGWNRDRRFLKAVYEAPQGAAPPSAVVQYDVLLDAGGPEQLTDHLAIWRGLLPEFARLTSGAAAPATGS